MRNDWQEVGDEFVALDQGEGWPFALLIACATYRTDNPGGRPSVEHRERMASLGKVSIDTFSEYVRANSRRVGRHLDAWEAAAAEGFVPHAADLTPADRHRVPLPDVPWLKPRVKPGEPESDEGFYDARGAGGRPRDSKVGDAVAIIERRGASAVVEAMPPAQRREVFDELARVASDEADLAAIARGGRVPSLDEINAGVGESALDVALDEAAREARVMAAVEHLRAAIRQYGPIPEGTPLHDRVRTSVMEILEWVLTGESA